ncbi:type II toxin-antitoxin system RelB/DinJ family antitoxin [Pediococcus pentosaceus]|uniref:type II toxin-antitoxin system RelB/DinJ family antitoxin n=1 Tax=Pediococcus pentosaceus TaxID=1255 RepID=UPI003B50C696
MKKYTTVSARIDSEKALEAKAILQKKGVSVSIVIRSLLIQITETGDVPFKI